MSFRQRNSATNVRAESTSSATSEAETVQKARRPKAMWGQETRTLRNSESRTQQLEQALEQIVDLGLAGVIFLAPLFLGGRHALGELILVACVAVMAVAWGLRSCLQANFEWRWTGSEWLLIAGGVLLVTQLAPWPTAVLQRLSPSLGEHLPFWMATNEFGFEAWPSFSLVPSATRAGFVLFLAYALLFVITTQRIRQVADVQRLLRWIALAAIALAGFGLLQWLFSNGKFFWFYSLPGRDTWRSVRGPFANENHFAHLLGLAVGPLLWWWQSLLPRPAEPLRQRSILLDLQRGPRLWLLGGMVIVGSAGLCTFSRGGVVIIGVAAAITVGLLMRAKLLTRGALGSLAAVGLVSGLLLLFHNYGGSYLFRQMQTLGAGNWDQIDHRNIRRELWGADLKAAAVAPWLGTGVGSHRYVYRIHFAQYVPNELTHAESSFVQLLVEVGAIGLGLALCGVVMVGRWCWRGWRISRTNATRACFAALIPMLSISVLHSLFDFVWFVPACFSWTLVGVACVARLYGWELENLGPCERTTEHEERTPSLTLRIGVSLAMIVICLLLVRSCVGPAMASVHHDRFWREMLAQRDGLEPTSPDLAAARSRQLYELNVALRRDPHQPQAQLKAAQLLLAEFHFRQQQTKCPFDLVQIRDATWQANFPNQATQDQWLKEVLGENRQLLDLAGEHAHRAVRLCPLQGEAYLYLAQLGFLRGFKEDHTRACVQQAYRVRPFSGDVLFTLGAEAALAGDVEQQFEFWRQAFPLEPHVRRQIIALTPPALNANEFCERFVPDDESCRLLLAHYQQTGRHADARFIARRLIKSQTPAAALAIGPTAAVRWGELQQWHQFLDDHDAALACAHNVVHALPNDLASHRTLASCLVAAEQWSAAAEEIQWCLRRRPDDAELKRELKEIMQRRWETMARAKREPME